MIDGCCLGSSWCKVAGVEAIVTVAAKGGFVDAVKAAVAGFVVVVVLDVVSWAREY